MADGSVERRARNEAFFRAVNEQLERIFARSGATRSYVCECSRGDCVDRIELTRTEYLEVRSHPARFAVKPGHQAREAEQVVAENGRFTVVEKTGAAAAYVDGGAA
jgi:hypothetical protein